jgi:hypothetical protein
MKKLTLLAPFVFAVPLAAYSADASSAMPNLKHSGFLDIVYTLNDGTDENLDANGDSTIDKKFDASGELDLETNLNPSSALRFDLDISTATTAFEQAFVNHSFNENMALKAGLFNNILGFEKEDAPDMYQTSHSQLWDIWDEQTALNGNNLGGAEFSAKVSMVTLYAGLLNDLNQTNEKVSFQLAAQIQPMESMDIVAGMVTADNGTPNDAKAGTIFDANISWKWQQLMLGGELLAADEIYNLGMQVTANYAFTDFFSGTARIDYVDYEANYDSTTSLTIGALFTVDENLYANAEIRAMQNNNAAGSTNPNPMRKVGDGSMVLLEMIGTF